MDNCLSRFFLTTLPPTTHHQLNLAESLGNACFIPIAHAGGTFHVKTKEGESLFFDKVLAIALIIITLPLTIIGIVLKGLGEAWPHDEIQATDETANLRLTNPRIIQQCYALSKVLLEVCRENGFVDGNGIPRFMACDGTTLGAVRHEAMIPWDDDCDYVVFEQDEQAFLALESALRAKGVEIDRSIRFNSLYKLRFIGDDSHAAIDVGIWSKMDDGSYTFDTAYARSNWPQDYVTAEEMAQGVEMRRFHDFEIPCLRNPDGYLRRYYGDNYMTHGIETHSHFDCCGITLSFIKFDTHYYRLQRYALPQRPVEAHPAVGFTPLPVASDGSAVEVATDPV